MTTRFLHLLAVPLLIAVALLASPAGTQGGSIANAAYASYDTRIYWDIEIVGTPQFAAAVMSALYLIASHGSQDTVTTARHIRRVAEMAQDRGTWLAYMTRGQRTAHVLPRGWRGRSAEALASTLVHEGMHMRLYALGYAGEQHPICERAQAQVEAEISAAQPRTLLSSLQFWR